MHEVDPELSRDLLEVSGLAEVLLEDGMVLRKDLDFFDPEPLILGAKKVLDVVTVDNCKIGYTKWPDLHDLEPSTSAFR